MMCPGLIPSSSYCLWFSVLSNIPNAIRSGKSSSADVLSRVHEAQPVTMTYSAYLLYLERLDWIMFSVAQCVTCSVCNSFYLPSVFPLDLHDSMAITHCVVYLFILIFTVLLLLCPKRQTLIRNTGFCNKLPHVPFLILLLCFHVSIDYCASCGFFVQKC